MKLSHKLIMVSAAALMTVSPVISQVSPNATVEAAKKSSKKKTTVKKTSKKQTTSKKKTSKSKKTTKKISKKTSKKNTKKSVKTSVKADQIVLSHNSYIYFSNGKRNKNYKVGNKVWPKLNKGVKLNAFGTKVIKGKLYYFIGNNSYIKAANVGTVNGKKVSAEAAENKNEKETTKTIKLTHNAYVYNYKGKRIKKAGTLKKNSEITYVGTRNIKKKKYFNLGKGQYIKAANAKIIQKNVDKIEPGDEDTYIKIVTNSITYDENGDAYTPTIWQLKGTDCRVISAQKIKGKWYYQIGSVKGATQWIKAVNAYVVAGPTLIKDPSYKEPTPDVDVADTIVTLRVGAPTYNSKGEVISNNSFNAGQSLRVSKLVWIYLPSEKQSVQFYKIASDSKSYIRVDDVDLISGKNLTAVNTSEDAYETGVIATSSDKSELASLINNASTVKNSDSYKLASNDDQVNYNNAIALGENVNTDSKATLHDVKNALNAIKTALSSLNGAKITVFDRNNLSSNEIDAIIKLAAKVNNVSESDVHFTDNNQNLSITTASGYTRTEPVTNYLN